MKDERLKMKDEKESLKGDPGSRINKLSIVYEVKKYRRNTSLETC